MQLHFRTLAVAALIAASLVSCKKEDSAQNDSTKSVDSAKAATPPTPGGIVIDSKEGKFSITLPPGFGNPTLKTNPIETDAGKIDMHLYSSEKSDGSAFILSFNDYPIETFDMKPMEKMMDDVRDGVIGDMKGNQEKQTDFKYEGSPARSVWFNTMLDETHKGYGRLDYIIAKPRLYQMIYIGMDASTVESNEVKNAFNSFKIVK